MIREIVQILEIDIFHINMFVFDHDQFHVIDATILLLYFVIVMKISILIELHHVRVTLKVITNEETLDLFTILLSENTAIVLSLDRTIETAVFRILSFWYRPASRPRSLNAAASRIFLNKVQPNSSENHDHYTENFSSQKANWKLICIPLNWQKL